MTAKQSQSQTPLTVAQAAARLKMSPRNLREICERNNIGVMVNERLRILAVADLPRIKAARRPRGNPNFQRAKKSGRKP